MLRTTLSLVLISVWCSTVEAETPVAAADLNDDKVPDVMVGNK